MVRRIQKAPALAGGLVLVEGDVGTGHQHAADLAAWLPDPATAAVTTDPPDADRLRESDALYVIAPRLWDLLEHDLQSHERVVLMRHVFEEADALALGEVIALEASRPSTGPPSRSTE